MTDGKAGGVHRAAFCRVFWLLWIVPRAGSFHSCYGWCRAPLCLAAAAVGCRMGEGPGFSESKIPLPDDDAYLASAESCFAGNVRLSIAIYVDTEY